MEIDDADISMNVVIENCRSIDRACISIDPKKLNVKFAPNGTGKSSIAKALVAAVNGSDGSNLVPFKWLQQGSSEEHPLHVEGFNAFVRTPEFVDTERELKSQLGALAELAEREDVRKMSVDLETFLTNLIGKSGLTHNKEPRSSSPIVTALKDGNTWEHGDPQLVPFQSILGTGSFKKWASWHRQGGTFLSQMDGVCPYCGQPSSDAEERINAVDSSFGSTKVGNIEKTIEALSVGSAYMDEATVKRLNEIVDSTEPLSSQARGYIGKVAQDAKLISSTFAKLKTVSSYFDLSKAEDLDARLADCQLDISLVASFDSAKCREVATEINAAVEGALHNVGKLKGLVNRQKDALAKSLKGRCKEVNAFLAAAGYPYTVAISGVENGECTVRLVHTSSWEVTDSSKALSYGEKNAFALVFFAYECMRNEPDLIILDDPISSFDGTKRYALLSMLFLGGIGEATLKGKTVLLLTHDYGTLFDIEHTHKCDFQPSAKSSVLSCANGVVKEAVVNADDMVLADALYEGLARSSTSLMTKLVYARKVLEIRKDKGEAYDVVSSLFHHRSAPTSIDKNPMTPPEVASGAAQLGAIVGDTVDYPALLKTIESPKEMLELFDGASSNYEKLQLARIATEANTDDKVLKERMDDSVHVGNGFLYQLDPTKFELVPLQLVRRCREELAAMVNEEGVSCSIV